MPNIRRSFLLCTDQAEECLRLTKALQKTSETLQNVADLYDDHVRCVCALDHLPVVDKSMLGTANAARNARSS